MQIRFPITFVNETFLLVNVSCEKALQHIQIGLIEGIILSAIIIIYFFIMSELVSVYDHDCIKSSG